MKDIVIRGRLSETRAPLVRKQLCCHAPDHSEFFRSPCEDLPTYVDLLCFSHNRWDSGFKRPQHLMKRWARNRRVFFVEEPVIGLGTNTLRISKRDHGVTVITPHLNPQANRISVQQQLFFDFFYRQKIRTFISWYTSPMFMPYTSHLRPEFVVYDSADVDGGTKVSESEYELFTIADLVFADGLSQYEAKSQLHPNVHAFPSCIDFDHFSQARVLQLDPLDQRDIPNPRLGYHGVIDERMDQELIDAVAEKRPEWHWVFVGSVLKIDPEKLPRRSNIHYLGDKDYKSLPSYMSGWDVAVLPLAGDDACRCMSSGKASEYLAAGKPVVSTPVRDVVRPYGERGLVSIANDAAGFIAGIEKSLTLGTDWRKKVDSYLWNLSWDQTSARMNRLMAEVWTDAKSGQHHTAPRPVTREETNLHA